MVNSTFIGPVHMATVWPYEEGLLSSVQAESQ